MSDHNGGGYEELDREANEPITTPEPTEHIHEFGPFERSRIAGTLHRKCVGCSVVSLERGEEGGRPRRKLKGGAKKGPKFRGQKSEKSWGQKTRKIGAETRRKR